MGKEPPIWNGIDHDIHRPARDAMENRKDDPSSLLFTCRRCGFWPMAYVKPSSWSGEASFGCPRCKSSEVFVIRMSRHPNPTVPAKA
jgi:hypothetical protein